MQSTHSLVEIHNSHYQHPFTDASFVAHVEDAFATLKDCFERYKPHEVIVAFNGGKDCIVILHLAYAYLKASSI